jgi:hypothetical protein
VAGASIDHADVDFTGTNQLGVIDPNTLLVTGTGVFIDQPTARWGRSGSRPRPATTVSTPATPST